MEPSGTIPDKRYEFTARSKMISYVLIAIGVVSVAVSFSTHGHQAWSNLLWNNFYFMVIGLAAVFFLAIQYASEASWSISIRRIPEAIAMYMPWGAGLMAIILIGNYISGSGGGHYLYHWWHHELFDPKDPGYDKIIAGKAGFLNMPFFIIRVLFYFAVWVGFAMYFRRMSLKQDLEGGPDHHLKMRSGSYKFLVLFAITSSLMAWDFIMAIDTHWYSTLFGWYTFAGLFISGISVIAIMLVVMKRKGLMDHVSEHHIHNVGLFMFAFSIFWTYLWFAQFMLIWYTNIPEEVTYFMVRQDHYQPLWIGNFFINFCVPILFLMTRDAKRKPMVLLVVGVILFFGHWIDTFQMVTPGVAGEHGHLGWIELGTMLGFLGLFRYVVLNQFAKAPVVAARDPFMEESMQHSF